MTEASRIGVDTGGTFTDFVALLAGRLVAFKLRSTPRAPESAVLEGLRRAGAGAGTEVRHGSTVATNTLLERKGARVALVTTAGFEDLLEIGRQDRPDLYSLAPRRPAPLVPRSLRRGVRERMGPRGERWTPLTRREARRVARLLGRQAPEAVAIALLHSYAEPAHERLLASELSGLGLPLTLSSRLCPEYREYERTCTTVLNAYLAPRVGRYLRAIGRGTRARVEVVLSHGGTSEVEEASEEPVRQLLSGPAAGLAAAAAVARACRCPRALTLDVGGTSTDCAYLEGELPRSRTREVGGHPVLLPLLDVHTVGAGGGSIARVDAAGILRVGPESAGADPGPACYGRGGPATVTDALVVLGRIAGEDLAGGALKLDRAAAERAVARLGRSLGARNASVAAEGVVRVAEAHIEAALRKVSVERGHDPRGAALVAFGGAGGLHACAAAEALGVRTVIAPRDAGMLSALGALLGGRRREASRTVLLASGERGALERVWRELERQVRGAFPARAPGLRVERWAEVRYAGQSHEIALSGAPGLEARFHREHQRRFGFSDPERRVEVVTLEVRASLPPGPLPRYRAGRSPAAPARRVTVRHQGRPVATRLWQREALRRTAIAGPAIVTESGATLWVPPGWRAEPHSGGALILRRGR